MEHTEEEAFLIAMKHAGGAVLPMVVKTAVDLDLFELIKKSENVTASELAAQLPTTNPDAEAMLDRILRLLAANSILSCSVVDDGRSVRRYGLSPVGKYFTKNEDGVSICSLTSMIQDKVLMESWYHLKGAILEGGSPIERAHGVSIYGYAAKDSRISKILNKTMSDSTLLYKKLIQMYKGFDEGIQTVVDVGGGMGTTLSIIISNHPSIKGINFDLPHVIQNAPSYLGIQHIGGDMFVSVPKGDAIFMKGWHMYLCSGLCLIGVKILRNCKETVPENGKVVIVDYLLPEIPKSGTAAGYGELSDVLMLAYNPGAKLRTETELRALAKAAGFMEFRKVYTAFSMLVVEFHKSSNN